MEYVELLASSQLGEGERDKDSNMCSSCWETSEWMER